MSHPVSDPAMGRASRRLNLWKGGVILAAVTAGAVGQWLLGDPRQTSYVFTVPHQGRFVGGLLLLVAGAVLFGWAVHHSRRVLPNGWPTPTKQATETPRPGVGRPSLVGWFLAVPLAGVSVAGLAFTGYRPIWGWLLLVGLLLACAAFALYDRRGRVRWFRPLRSWEVGLLALVVAAFIGLNSYDLTNWYYSAIGDEYAFFHEARRIALGGEFDPFAQKGVYGYHPLLSSAYQALVMRLFGVNHFGWKLSSVLAVALALPPFYLLVSTMVGRRVAVFATVFMASSHFLFGYAHTGYNNLQALPVSLAAFWLFFAGIQRRSALLLFAAGALAALCFYTVFTARITPVILAFYTLLAYRGLPPRWLLAPSLAGAALVLTPFLVVNGNEVVGGMLGQSTARIEGMDTAATVWSMLVKTFIHAIAFNYNVQPHHYVTGSLMDPASAVLATLGAAVILAALPDRRAFFLAVWWLVGLVATGTLSPHDPYVVLSRLHYQVPLYAIGAGLAMHHLLGYGTAVAASWRLPAWWRTAAVAGGSAGVLALVVALNLYRFWGQSPTQAPVAFAAAAVRAVHSPLCAKEKERAVVADEHDFLRAVLDSYAPGSPLPRFLTRRQLATEEGARVVLNAVCVVIMLPREVTQTEVAALLPRAPALWHVQVVTDYTGSHRVFAFVRQR